MVRKAVLGVKVPPYPYNARPGVSLDIIEDGAVEPVEAPLTIVFRMTPLYF